MLKQLWLIILGVSVCYVGNVPQTRAEDLMEAEDIYKMQCKRCHGAQGQGNSKMLRFLRLQDRGPEVLSLLKDDVKNMKDEEITHVILEGKGKKMKPFKDKLSRPQASDLTKLIRKLQKAPQ